MAVTSPSVDWLMHRLDVFERFCAPSLLAQTNMNFTWLLAVSEDCPKWVKRRARRAAPCAEFVVAHRLYPNWRKLIQPFLRNESRLLTTRCDNDDALHKDFVDVIQEAAIGLPHSTVVDSRIGYQMNLGTLRCGIRKLPHPSPFCSLIEDNNRKWTTVCRENHARLRERHRYHAIKTGPLWVQICHRRNIKNHVKTRLQFEWADIAADFGHAEI